MWQSDQWSRLELLVAARAKGLQWHSRVSAAAGLSMALLVSEAWVLEDGKQRRHKFVSVGSQSWRQEIASLPAVTARVLE